MFDEKILEFEIGGRKLKVSTGKVARQASGAVMVQYGETVVLATAVGKKEAREGQDFFPLTVDFIEKMYSSGKVPGGFYKREAKPSTNATLTARLIDRPIRPLFPDGYKNDVHIVITVVSYDGENTPDYLGIIGASAALSISDIPFYGPVAGVTVGYIDGEFVLNPTTEQLEVSEIELAVAGTKDAITMVEAGAKEVSEEVMLQAVMFGHENIKKICEFQEEFVKLAGKDKMEFTKTETPELVQQFLDEKAVDGLREAVVTIGKHAREEAVDALEDKLLEEFAEKYSEEENFDELERFFKKYYHDLMKKLVREAILVKHHRADGRGLTDIRQLDVEVDVLPMPHGSALFTRGETQSLSVATLGTKEDEQIIDGLNAESRQKFYLHYNFPPYSVGETGFMRGPGRRELGHGALAERAIRAVVPDQENFPYTIRLVSEITESNGSSSMATVCGGSLALMDAGVPVKNHVAGIAMGLIKEGEEYVVLTDIMGLEDHLGDMDFKVAGTKEGITALQMDIKITGIDEAIMKQALKQALDARMFILNTMENSIKEPKEELAPNVPRHMKMKIAKDKIADLIGPGGKYIKAIIEETGATIDIDDDGGVMIFSADKGTLERTVDLVNQHTKDIQVGEVYTGKVIKILKFGALVSLTAGKDGLLHVSEISKERVNKVEDVLKVDDEVTVKVLKVENGKVSVSKKALL